MLAVLVVFLFLRDWRATLISALAIPLSAIPTFWFMELMGFSLNGLSLLALSLVAGVLVDDAIVEIENIVRHMRMGKSAYQAAIDAADEIGLAVVATTFSIVAVFMPVGLMPGISGQFFKNFGFTVVAAVLTSLAVARLITPLAAAYFLKAKGPAKHGEGWLMDRYVGMLRWSLSNRWKTVMIGVARLRRHDLLVRDPADDLPAAAQPRLQPGPDRDAAGLDARADRRRRRTRSTRLLRTKPEVENAFADVGPTSAELFVTLKKDRERTSVEFERAYSPELQAIPDARINFQSQAGDRQRPRPQPHPGRRRSGQDRARRREDHRRDAQAARDPGAADQRRAAAARDHDQAAARPRRRPRRDDRGAQPDDPDRDPGRHRPEQRQILAVRPPGADPGRAAADLAAQHRRRSQNLPVPTASGGSVPLKHVAEISFGAGPSEVKRYNQRRRTSIGADLAPGIVTSDAMKKIEALPSVHEPARRASRRWRSERPSGRRSWSTTSCSPSSPESSSSSRCWSCSTRGCCRRSSTWARFCSRRWAGRSRSTSPAMRCRCR